MDNIYDYSLEVKSQKLQRVKWNLNIKTNSN